MENLDWYKEEISKIIEQNDAVGYPQLTDLAKYITEDINYTKLYHDILYKCSNCQIKFRKNIV